MCYMIKELLRFRTEIIGISLKRQDYSNISKLTMRATMLKLEKEEDVKFKALNCYRNNLRNKKILCGNEV